MDLFKRVQAAGKSIYFGLGKDELETVIRPNDWNEMLIKVEGNRYVVTELKEAP